MTAESPVPPAHAAVSSPKRRFGPGMPWVRLGGILMAIIGVFGIIEGIGALIDQFLFVTVNGTVFTVNLVGWGLIHIIVGVLVLGAGVALLSAVIPPWARLVALIFVSINILLQLVWLPAAPIWSILLIGLDIMVLLSVLATYRHDPV